MTAKSNGRKNRAKATGNGSRTGKGNGSRNGGANGKGDGSARMGRPRLEFDLRQVFKFGRLRCTNQELADLLDCGLSTALLHDSNLSESGPALQP